MKERLPSSQSSKHVWISILRTVVTLLGLLFLFRFIISFFHNRYPLHYGNLFWNNHVWYILHICGGSLVLILGSLQFSATLRKKSMPFHRIAGKLYIWGSFMALITLGIILYQCSDCEAGRTSKIFVASLWGLFTLAAWWAVIHKNIKSHRQFMARSYVCASYFVIVRILDTVGDIHILPFIKDPIIRYVDGDWLSWLIPLFLVEIYQSWWPALFPSKAK